ncbi:MAG: glycosyl hydrolase, partial [Chloroflexota bacterium]
MPDHPAVLAREVDQPGVLTALFESFQNPPKSASVNPFWFWQGKLDLDTLVGQMHAMVEQGVMCAIVHNRSGLQTPYLSDEYFAIVRGLLDEAARIGFQVNFVDEFNWPSGQGWDIWRPHVLNRVLEANPEARLKGVQVERLSLASGEHFAWDPKAAWFGASIVEWDPATEIIADSLVAVFAGDTAGAELVVPDGAAWLVLRYSLAEVVGVDGSLVDLLDPEAVTTFLQEVHALYEAKVGDRFGNVLGLFYLDHEGDYGGRIPWTKQLPAEFQRRKGYPVLECLPSLLYESPTLAGRRRFDFLDVISQLYVEHFWKRIADWCEARNLQLTGHAWEESLWNEAAFTGSLFRVQRALPLPGVDSLLERGRSPREIKESASVAHFESRGLSVENQAVLGIDSYLDPERMKIATNTLAVWGTTMFIPHAFNYNPARVDWPEDWFLHQPYWPYFHHYALYTRRLAFMNTQGQHSARVLLYAPLETAWAESRRIFDSDTFPEYRIDLPWGTALDEVEQVYSALMDGLVATQIDFDVADWQYVQEGRLEGRHLAIGPEQYQAIVLSPMTYISVETAHKLLTWAWAGGVVIAVGRRPTASVESGVGDVGLREAMHELFEAPGAPGILVD